MTVLVFGLIVFLGVHAVSIVAPAWRDQAVARVGEGVWKGGYSLVAGVGLGLVILGYGLARQSPVVLYEPPRSLRHLALLLMVPVFPLLLSTYLPGAVKRAAKHPMLVAVKLWALAHLLANGTLADVLLFGGFVAWAVVDRISVKRRSPAQAHAVPGAPPRAMNDPIAVVGGLVVYALIVLWAHRALFGVSPLP